MDASSRDQLIARADAAIWEAHRLRAEIDKQRALADAIRRHALQSKIFSTGLEPALAIALITESAWGDNRPLEGF